ncbi:MAG TPA: Hint domain-containing protein [Bacteroidia bacterium]|nr:Hint domain-containing protein [Bacteroidia bacterium]
MKKIFLLLLVALLSKVTFAQQLKILVPQLIRWNISDAERVKFERAQKLQADIYANKLKITELNDEDRKLVENLDETIESFLETVGGDCSWYCGGGIDTGWSTSNLASQKDNSYSIENIHDFDAGTAWIEGIKGYGIGEKITLSFPKANPPVTTVKVYNGYMKTERAWKENSRVRTLKMYINNKPYALLHLYDSIGCQEFITDTFKATKTEPLLLTFEIYDVYPGDKYDETAISEINFDGTGVHCFAAGTLVKMADGTEKPIENIVAGEMVKGFDFAGNKIITTRVTAVPRVKHHNLIRIIIENGSITVTDDHPFYIEGKGWCAFNPAGSYASVMEIKKLATGNLIKTITGFAEIKEITSVPVCEMTYSLILEDGNNFFANSLLVSASE